MLAIVDLNGKQYQVEEGRYVTVDRLPHDVDHTFEISNVMMIVDGEASLVGAPFVEGATVRAKVLRHDRGPKLLVYKMRRKKGYRLKNGHRQDFTQLQIEIVDFPGKKERPAKAVEAPAETKKPAKKAEKAPAGDKAAKSEEKKAPKASAKTAEPKPEKKAAKPKAEVEEVKAQDAPTEAVQPEAATPETPETQENTEA